MLWGVTMKNFQFKRVIENKYSHLLVALIIFFILAPVLDKLNQFFPCSHFLLYLIIIAMFRILKVRKKLMLWIVFLGILALTLEYMSRKMHTPIYMIALIDLAYVLFLGNTIILLTKNVFQEKIITSDTIKGGISIYLLLGFWWIFVYSLIIILDSDAIIAVNTYQLDLVSLYQFSFSTLTTVGYGNILPKSELAITLANIEAVTGQVYLTVFIARLVGIQITNNLIKNQKTDK